ncbi:MAG: GAF domain-containing protein [Pseudomonadales bacterium]|nr:GAF domain-containing protein [Pseudomonadales bacterium]
MKEKNYNALLLKIFSSMMARVGATNSYLVIVTDGDFTVRAHGKKNTSIQMSQRHINIDNTKNLCPEICRFAARSQSPVILGDACESQAYGANIAVQRFRLKSVLALPLIAEGRTLGVIYLENSLISHVFQETEVERLQVLTTQAAIALDNNFLIDRLTRTQITLKQRKAKLKAEQVLQSAMLNNLSEAVILMDHMGIIQRFNLHASDIFGCQESEIIGQKLDLLIQPPAPIRATTDGGIDVKGVRKNGDLFPFHLTIAQLPSSETQENRFVISGQDMTVKELQQEMLQRSQKTEALGKLTGGIAHGYNNILGVILGFSELLEPIVEGNTKGSNYLEQIQIATHRGATLTKKMLSYSKQRPSKRTTVNVNNIILAQQNMLEEVLTVRIQLEMNLKNNIPLIDVDVSDLENTILNLCINAMHAIPSEGQLVIQTDYQVLFGSDATTQLVSDGEYVTISFTDDGLGMNKDTQTKVFDPFFTTKGEGGAGLGLSQAYGFMERSQGVVTVHFDPDKGACFTLFFPLSNSAVENQIENNFDKIPDEPHMKSSMMNLL